ncbi:hypothetical protein, partial [Rhodococcus aerolatus]
MAQLTTDRTARADGGSSPAPESVLRGTPASAGRASGRVVRVADPVAEPGALPAPADAEAEAA